MEGAGEDGVDVRLAVVARRANYVNRCPKPLYTLHYSRLESVGASAARVIQCNPRVSYRRHAPWPLSDHRQDRRGRHGEVYRARVTHESLPRRLVTTKLVDVVPAPSVDERAQVVRHSRRYDELVAECQSLDRALLVVDSPAVLRVTELVADVLLVEVHDECDHDAAGQEIAMTEQRCVSAPSMHRLSMKDQARGGAPREVPWVLSAPWPLEVTQRCALNVRFQNLLPCGK